MNGTLNVEEMESKKDNLFHIGTHVMNTLVKNILDLQRYDNDIFNPLYKVLYSRHLILQNPIIWDGCIIKDAKL